MLDATKQVAESKILLLSSSITSIGGGAVATSPIIKNSEVVQSAIGTCEQHAASLLEEWAYAVPWIGLVFLGIQAMTNLVFKILERRDNKKTYGNPKK